MSTDLKVSLKITKGYAEAINRRRDNTMFKRKSTNNDLYVHGQLKIEQPGHLQKPG